MPGDLESPPEGETGDAQPAQLAWELLVQEERLWLRVLHRLLGEPRRFRDLAPLLQGRSENNLTYALKKLVAEGLASRRLEEAEEGDPIPVYSVTHKGIETYVQSAMLSRMGEFFSASTGESGAPQLRFARSGPLAVQTERLLTDLARGSGFAGDAVLADPLAAPAPTVIHLRAEASRSGTRPDRPRIYHLHPMDAKTWRLVRQGAERATMRSESFHEALAEGIELAGGGGAVVVEDQDGNLELLLDFRTVERADPPAGLKLTSG